MSGYGITDASQLGVGQTWQDVTASRAQNTVYQNTTGKPIALSINSSTVGGYGKIQVSVDSVTWVEVGGQWPDTSGAARMDSGFTIVPAGHYYKYINQSFARWTELR